MLQPPRHKPVSTGTQLQRLWPIHTQPNNGNSAQKQIQPVSQPDFSTRNATKPGRICPASEHSQHSKAVGAFLAISETPDHAANQRNESDFSSENGIAPYLFTLKNAFLEILIKCHAGLIHENKVTTCAFHAPLFSFSTSVSFWFRSFLLTPYSHWSHMKIVYMWS